MGLANGILCCGPSIFVSAAFCLSIVSTSLCNFFELDIDNQFRKTANVQAIGFWCWEGANGNRYEYSGVLEAAQDQDFDYARAFGFTANIAGMVIWLIYLFAACIPFPSKVFMCTGMLCHIVCMFEGFKFWLKRSTAFCDSDSAMVLGCTMDTGAYCSISAAVLWFLAGCMTCAHGKERMGVEEERNSDDREQPNEPEDPKAEYD